MNIKIPGWEVASVSFKVRAPEKWDLIRDGHRPNFHIMSLLPAVLILSALFIDVAAGRWGAYILTPIPGLYLPDALLVLGILTSPSVSGWL